MQKFNLKKRQNRKNLYRNKNNLLFHTGSQLINDKLKFIKKDLISCLFLDDAFNLSGKEVSHVDTCDIKNIKKSKSEYSSILSNFSTQIEFSSNLDDCLISIYNKLDKDGLFCFNVLTPNSMKTLNKIFIEIDESIFKGSYNRFGPFHDVSLIIEKLNLHNFKDIVVGIDLLELNYKSFTKLRQDFREFGISNYYNEIPKFKKEFLIKSNSIFSKIIEKYNHISVEFEIATFTSWK
jgi:hypothetical protein